MAKLEHEMTVLLEMKHSPIMREFVYSIVRETLRQAKDLDLIRDATQSNTLASELAGRTIKIEGPTLVAHAADVKFADTGESVPGIRRVELTIDAQTGEMNAKLYRWGQDDRSEAILERAITSDVEVSTLARIEEVE